MEFKITMQKPAEAITFNYEEIKAELLEKIEFYRHIVYTEDSFKQAKADRAELNKLKKALNDKRLEVQKEYMKPFDLFKTHIDELIEYVNMSAENVDAQVKEYETKVKNEKKKTIEDFFNLVNKYSWLRFEQIFDQKWLNASVSMGAVENEINIILTGIEVNLNSLKGLEYEFEAMEFYKESLSLPMAIMENKRLIDLANKKNEQVKVETSDEPRTRMSLTVNINTKEYDALTEWLNSRGIEWSIA